MANSLHKQALNFRHLEIIFGFKICGFVFLTPFWPIVGSLLADFADQFDLTMFQDILFLIHLGGKRFILQKYCFENLEIRYGIKIGNFVFLIPLFLALLHHLEANLV